jgi:hypothetical protein
LRFDQAPPPGYRALIYLNGWNIGQYGGGIGPQTSFVLPSGPLRPSGANTLAVAVVATGAATVATPRLEVLGRQRGGVPLTSLDHPSR